MDEKYESEDEVSEDVEFNYDNLIEELSDYCKLYHLPIFNNPNILTQ